MYFAHRIFGGRADRLWIAVLSIFLVISTGCGHASTSSRIRRLADKEAELKTSVDQLVSRQQMLRAEIVRAEGEASLARCRASQEGYKAVVASVYSEYSAAIAAQKGCEASAAKDGGTVMALGCGLATLLSGGWALALCGGSLVAGMAVTEGCGTAPPRMSPAEIERVAQQKTGLSGLPRCDGRTALATERRQAQGFLYRPTGDATGTHGDAAAGSELFPAPSRREARRARAAERRQDRVGREERRAAEKRYVEREERRAERKPRDKRAERKARRAAKKRSVEREKRRAEKKSRDKRAERKAERAAKKRAKAFKKMKRKQRRHR